MQSTFSTRQTTSARWPALKLCFKRQTPSNLLRLASPVPQKILSLCCPLPVKLQLSPLEPPCQGSVRPPAVAGSQPDMRANKILAQAAPGFLQ